MALQTGGFRLSELARAPRLDMNVRGDTLSGLGRGLSSFGASMGQAAQTRKEDAKIKLLEENESKINLAVADALDGDTTALDALDDSIRGEAKIKLFQIQEGKETQDAKRASYGASAASDWEEQQERFRKKRIEAMSSYFTPDEGGNQVFDSEAFVAETGMDAPRPIEVRKAEIIATERFFDLERDRLDVQGTRQALEPDESELVTTVAGYISEGEGGKLVFNSDEFAQDGGGEVSPTVLKKAKQLAKENAMKTKEAQLKLEKLENSLDPNQRIIMVSGEYGEQSPYIQTTNKDGTVILKPVKMEKLVGEEPDEPLFDNPEKSNVIPIKIRVGKIQ